MIDQPTTALADILTRPRWRWLLPVGLRIVALAIAAVLMAPMLAENSAAEMDAISGQLSQLGGEQAAQVQRQLAALQTPFALGVTQFVSGLLGSLITWIAQAGIIYILSAIAGGSTGFMGILAAAPWLGVPMILDTVLSTGYAVHTQQIIANQGLSYLASTGDRLADAASFAYVALGQVSVFRLWHLVLVFVLFRTVHRDKGGSAVWLTVVYAGVFLVISFAFAGLNRLLASGF